MDVLKLQGKTSGELIGEELDTIYKFTIAFVEDVLSRGTINQKKLLKIMLEGLRLFYNRKYKEQLKRCK